MVRYVPAGPAEWQLERREVAGEDVSEKRRALEKRVAARSEKIGRPSKFMPGMNREAHASKLIRNAVQEKYEDEQRRKEESLKAAEASDENAEPGAKAAAEKREGEAGGKKPDERRPSPEEQAPGEKTAKSTEGPGHRRDKNDTDQVSGSKGSEAPPHGTRTP